MDVNCKLWIETERSNNSTSGAKIIHVKLHTKFEEKEKESKKTKNERRKKIKLAPGRIGEHFSIKFRIQRNA